NSVVGAEVTGVESESGEAKGVSRMRRRLKRALMVFLCSLAVFEVYILLRPRPAPVVLLPLDYEWKMSLSARFNRFTHGWFYRTKVFLFGLPQSILIEEKIVTFDRTAEGLNGLNLPEAVFSNENVSVWIMPRE